MGFLEACRGCSLWTLQREHGSRKGGRSGYEIPVLEGQEVEHTQYGPGTVVSQREAVITVRYGNVEKKQKLPFVVAGGFMHLKDSETETQLVHMDDLDKQKASLDKEIQYINSLLGDLEKA